MPVLDFNKSLLESVEAALNDVSRRAAYIVLDEETNNIIVESHIAWFIDRYAIDQCSKPPFYFFKE